MPRASCVYTNAAYHKISGLSFEQTLGTNWSMAIHPEDRERVLAEWRGAARAQAPFQTEFRFLREDESIVWTRVNSAAMLDGKKSPAMCRRLRTSPSARRRSSCCERRKRALFEEKERAQVTLNSIGDAVLTTDLAGQRDLSESWWRRR